MPTAILPKPDAATRHGASPTAHAIEELQLYGLHLNDDDPDPRPLPEADALEAALTALFDALIDPLTDTRLEPELPDLLWSLTDLFHRKAQRIERQLDDNEQRQRQSQAEQDGSEVRSVELERLIVRGQTLMEKRAVFEMLRERAADHFQAFTGSVWQPRTGSRVNHKTMTAAMIDSRDFIAAKRRAETEVHLPAGPKIAFGGGIECSDHSRIWAALDKVLAKHPDMVLLHGGSPRGAERIAACWADNRKVTQITFKPDWTRGCAARRASWRADRVLDGRGDRGRRVASRDRARFCS